MPGNRVPLGCRARDASPFGLDMVAIMVIELSDYAPRWYSMGDYALTWHEGLSRKRRIVSFALAWRANAPTVAGQRHAKPRKSAIVRNCEYEACAPQTQNRRYCSCVAHDGHPLPLMIDFLYK